jgi:hypothetical protein
MRELRFVFSASLLLSLSIAASGQTMAKKGEPVTGSVTGQVSCVDTNAPARFAVVTLQPVSTEKATDASKAQDSGTNATATTDLEGRFELDKVSTGRYYVLGSLSGYLNPLARFDHDQLEAMTTETQKELARLVPIVDVEAGQAATVTLSLEHASELSGTVLYDDGSPAVGLQVAILHRDKDRKLVDVKSELIEGLSYFGSHVFTDDRGRYQLIGIPQGEYTICATLPGLKVSVSGLFGGGELSVNAHNEEGEKLNVYSGNTFRKKDAKTVKVGQGEQLRGVDITIPVGGLHTVRGTVTAKRDGHALNAGLVDLLYADNEDSARSVHLEEDGSFVLTYVPEDKYILRLSGGADSEIEEIHPYPGMTVRQDKTIRNYGAIDIPLLVQGDVSGLELAAPDAAAAKVAQE